MEKEKPVPLLNFHEAIIEMIRNCSGGPCDHALSFDWFLYTLQRTKIVSGHKEIIAEFKRCFYPTHIFIGLSARADSTIEKLEKTIKSIKEQE